MNPRMYTKKNFIMRQLLVFEGRITEDYSDVVSLRENCPSNSDGLHSKCSETQSSLSSRAFLFNEEIMKYGQILHN